MAATLDAVCGKAAAIVTVQANPTTASILSTLGVMGRVEAIVALGGGSVLDAAKAVAGADAAGKSLFKAHLFESVPLPPDLALPTIVAVPTTAGTGSEVTRWATIWGENGGAIIPQ